jgi:phage gp45-like
MITQQTKEVSQEVNKIDNLLTQAYNRGELSIFIDNMSITTIQYLRMHGYDVDEVDNSEFKSFLISW